MSLIRFSGRAQWADVINPYDVLSACYIIQPGESHSRSFYKAKTVLNRDTDAPVERLWLKTSDERLEKEWLALNS